MDRELNRNDMDACWEGFLRCNSEYISESHIWIETGKNLLWNFFLLNLKGTGKGEGNPSSLRVLQTNKNVVKDKGL